MTRILVVDDEDVIRQGFVKALEADGARFAVTTAGSGEEGLARLRAEPFDLVFVDLKMPGIGGLDVIEQGRRLRPEAEFVLMTGYASVDSAVGAMKLGAGDYLQKPFTRDELASHVDQADRRRTERILRREEEVGFERFTSSMRWQHIIVMVTFTLLSLTGIPLLFPTVFKGGFFFEDSAFLRGLVHRVAAVGLMLLSVYHVGWVTFTEDGHRNLRAILPRVPRDILDALRSVAYNLGLRKEPPRVGKYDFIEKLEYLGVVWGSLVMVLSGLVLWFTDAVLRVAPLWVIDVAKVVHRYEAILAMLTIAIWHMYCVHLRPGVFPMSRVWLDGRISRRDMIHHHPEEYEELTGRPAVLDADAAKEGTR